MTFLFEDGGGGGAAVTVAGDLRGLVSCGGTRRSTGSRCADSLLLLPLVRALRLGSSVGAAFLRDVLFVSGARSWRLESATVEERAAFFSGGDGVLMGIMLFTSRLAVLKTAVSEVAAMPLPLASLRSLFGVADELGATAVGCALLIVSGCS
ncbi:MAG: hypothetical protein WKF84_24365 [Pyrinomonadaceae bacterium]